MSKKTRKTPSVHSLVVSHISSQLPCDACEQCLRSAVDRAFDAIQFDASITFECCEHVKQVAAAFAQEHGDLEAVGCLVDAIAKRLRIPVAECLNTALQIMGYEEVSVPKNEQVFVLKLAA